MNLGDPWDMGETDCPCGSGLHHDQRDEDENLNPRICIAYCTWCGFCAEWRAETDTAKVIALPHSGGNERATRCLLIVELCEAG